MRSDVSARLTRVLLVGQGPTALTALQSLCERHDVVGLVRGPSGEPDRVSDLARRRGVRRFTTTTLTGVADAVSTTDPDIVVVSSYDRVLPADLVRQRPFVNVHYAPLPRYRGRAPVNWALINGDDSAAISIHVLAPDLDAGNLLFQQRVPVTSTTTVCDLYEQLNALQRENLGLTVARHLQGWQGVPQDQSRVSYGCTRVPEDGEIDWTSSAIEITRLVRALSPPFPPAFTHVGGVRLEVLVAEPVPDRFEGRVPGRVAARSREHGQVDVLAGVGTVRLQVVRLDGGQAARPVDVIPSLRTTLGLSTADLLARVARLEARIEALAAPPAPPQSRPVDA